METTKPFREFAGYSGLSVLGMLAISCYILADTFFVSQSLGTNGLAALNLAIPAYNVIHGTGLMVGMGGATRFSVLKSRRESKAADVMFTNTVYLAVFFSALFMLVGVFFSAPITALLGADSATFDMTNTYLKVLCIFAPAFIMNDVFLCFVRNDGNPGLAMAATVGGSFSNIILDYVFMFPMGMGIFGAVLATGMSPAIGILIMAPHWLKKSKGFHMVKTGLPLENIKINLALGFPSLLSQLSSGIVMIVFNGIILTLVGNTGVAAYGVVANLSLVISSIYTGIAQGIQPLVSREYGQKNREAERLFLRYAMISMAVISLLLYVIIYVFAGPIAMIFNSENNRELQQIAETGLRLYFTSALFMGYNVILSTYFTSVENAVPAHVVSLLRGLIVIVPVAFLMSAAWGMTGMWLACTATEIITAAAGAVLDARAKRRNLA